MVGTGRLGACPVHIEPAVRGDGGGAGWGRGDGSGGSVPGEAEESSSRYLGAGVQLRTRIRYTGRRWGAC